MNRRSFLNIVAAMSAGLAPVGTRAAERIRSVVFIVGLPLDHPIAIERFTTIRRQLAQRGWIEGNNLRSSLRSVGSGERGLAETVAEIVREGPDLISAGSSHETTALLAATRTIPILFATASDPIGSGFTRSLERPDGNATGFSNNEPAMAAKWVELLKDIAPETARIGVVYNPATAPARGATYIARFREEALVAGMGLVDAPVEDLSRLDGILSELSSQPRTGLVFPPDAFTFRNAKIFTPLIASHRLPAMYPYETFVQNGGLISYTGGRNESDEMAATYIDLILRGARISELPVQFSRSFELAINERAAAALGLSIPMSLRVRASRIIS